MMTEVNLKWIVLIILCRICGVISVHASVSGTIDDDITFYYQELPVQPSIIATIEYSIMPVSDYVDFQLYTASNHVNIKRKCSFRLYSKVYNTGMYERFHRTDCGTNACEVEKTKIGTKYSCFFRQYEVIADPKDLDELILPEGFSPRVILTRQVLRVCFSSYSLKKHEYLLYYMSKLDLKQHFLARK